MVLSNGFWPFPLHSAHSLPLLIPLFPSTPTLSVVKHVVKEPFLTRRGITAVACSEGLFFMFRFGVLYLCRGREARGFSSQAYQFLTHLYKEYSLAGRGGHLTCSGASKGQRRCAPPHGRSDFRGSTETPCRFPWPDRRPESLPYSA